MFKISIIIPCYNIASLIRACIFSIAQDENFHLFEILLIDDGSVDSTLSVLEELATSYTNVFVHKQKNAGQSSARNLGISISSAPLIGFVDGDDWVNYNYFSNLLQTYDETNCDVIFCNIYSISEDGKIDMLNTRAYKIDQFNNILIQNNFDRLKICSLYLSDRLSVSPCNKLYRKSLLIDNNIIFPEGLYNEDMEFTYDVLLNANSLAKEEKSIYYYRQTLGSTTKIANLRVLDMLIIVKRIIQKTTTIFGNALRVETVIFFLNNSVYVTIMRLRKSTVDTRDHVIKEISLNMKGIRSMEFILLPTFSIKRKALFLLIKHMPSLLKKILSYQWK